MENDSIQKAIMGRWIREALKKGKLNPHLAQRKTMRCAWPGLLELRFGTEILIAEGRDISPRGAGIRCDEEFPVGARIELRRSSDEAWAQARVARCTQRGGSFDIGVTFEHAGCAAEDKPQAADSSA